MGKLNARGYSRRLVRIVSLLIAFIAALVTAPPTLAATSPQFNPPKGYYLALGDSIAYGFQFSKFDAGLPPSGFNTGYVDDFTARLKAINPEIAVVNYGCPGESTASFVSGPCPSAGLIGLHDAFTGSQLDAAVAFLRAHPGEVSPITITLYGNDVVAFLALCGGDLSCIENGAPAVIAQISRNLATALGRLRAVAPGAEIILTGAYDAHIGAFQLADPLFEALNQAMAGVAAGARARFADPLPAFNPQGDLQAEEAAICAFTLVCTDGDGHPSDAGYQTIADLVFEASSYVRLTVEG